MSLCLGLDLRLVLLRGWLGAPDGREGGRHLRGDGGVLPRGRLRWALHVLQLLQLELLLELLLQLLLVELLLLQLLHVVLKMLLLHLLLDLLMHLVLLQLLLLHLLQLLLLQLLLLGLHGRAHLGGRRCAHHGGAHGADQWSPKVRWHVGRDGDGGDDLVHGQSHG